MDSNELIKERSWWARRKWLLIAVIVMFTLLIIVFVSGLKTLSNFGKAYTDKPLLDKALALVQRDSAATVFVGHILPLDDMAIANGSVDYSDNNAIRATVPIVGSFKKAKMDVVAHKIDGNWKFDVVKIRMKDPKQEIVVIRNQE